MYIIIITGSESNDEKVKDFFARKERLMRDCDQTQREILNQKDQLETGLRKLTNQLDSGGLNRFFLHFLLNKIFYFQKPVLILSSRREMKCKNKFVSWKWK